MKIELITPVPGHSFHPPDRVFGRIEERLRKMPTITNPNTYIELFAEHGIVRTLGDDCIVNRWKETETDFLKPLKS